jgi:MFS family permease
MFTGIKQTYQKFPKGFWQLMAVSFVDMLGGSLIFPFFSLYMTRKFDVGMTQVGTMFLVWALTSGVIGNTLGGAMADRFGRKLNMTIGLIASAVSALLMVLISDLFAFYIAIAIVGIFQDIAGPAREAMIADLVPESLRADAYGMFRIVFNLSVTIGPAVGGILAARSFETLFFLDVIISLIAAAAVLTVLPETRPAGDAHRKEAERSFRYTIKGYAQVLRDRPFIAFILVSILSTLMYFNMNSSLSVFLVNHRGLTPEQFGYILSLNAGMVVVLQLFISRLTAAWQPLISLALGNLLYVVGFSMYGFVDTYIWFLAAMAVITIGEMIIAPKEQALAAGFAPEHMRGRYMAVHAFVWVIPVAIGPLGAGLIMDNLDARLVWFAAGAIGLLAVAGFITLHLKAGRLFTQKVNGKTIAAETIST